MSKGIKLIFLLLVLVLVAGYFGTTYWIGGVTENEWRKQVADISASTPGIEINVTAYDRSFFSAAVTTEVTLTIPQDDSEEPLSLGFNSKVAHGPIVFSGGPAFLMLNVDTTLAPIGLLSEVFEKVPELKQMTFNEQVFFNLDYKGVGTLPAFDRMFGDEYEQVQVRFAGLNSQYSGSLKNKSLKATVSIPGVIVQSDSEEITMEMKNASVQFDMREAIDAIYVGTTEMTLESMVFSGMDDDGPETVSLSGLQANAVIDLADGLLTESIIYQLAEIDVNGAIYGPATVDLVLSNLDAEALSLIQKDLHQAQAAMLDQNSSALSQQSLADLKKNLLPLVKQSPKLEIRKLDVNTPFGKFTSKAQMQIDGEQVVAIDPPMLLIAALTADADLEIDKSLLKQIGAQYFIQSLQGQASDASAEVLELRAMQQAVQSIDGLVAANMLTDTGETYQLQAKFDRGSFFVNGQQM